MDTQTTVALLGLSLATILNSIAIAITVRNQRR